MSLTVVLSPFADRTYITSTGVGYTSDNFGIIESNTMSQQELNDLKGQGCYQLLPLPTNQIGYLHGVNMNTTADQAISVIINVKFRPTKIVVTNASTSLTLAVGGVYTGAGKTGTVLVNSSQAYSGLTSSSLAIDLTLNSPNAVLSAGTPIYVSLTTPQGGAATADWYVYGDTYQ